MSHVMYTASSPPLTDPQPPNRAYIHLVSAIACWFGFWGMHMVIFQWLVVEILNATPARVGSAQMAVMLPSLFLLLVGGAVADRVDPRRLLLAVHLIAAVVVMALCLFVAADALSYRLLIAYALAIGTLQAFGLPARDTKLSDVVSGKMSRAVAGVIAAQHAAQTLGAFAAGLAGWIGAIPILTLQGVLLLLGAGPLSRLPGRPKAHPKNREPVTWHDLRAGLMEVVRSPVLRPVLVLAMTTGVFFIGPFLVILPLLVRDVYGGGAAEMGILTGTFALGAVLGGVVIIGLGGINRSGLALGLSQIAGVASITVIATGLPFYGTVAAVLSWGICASVFINSGRTLFQEHASEKNRARVLSVYTLGFMGGGPIGSLLSGYLAGPLGLYGVLWFDGAVTLAVALAVITFMRLLTLR